MFNGLFGFVNYLLLGTSCILRPNLERHLNSNGHKRCLEIKTGKSQERNQTSLSSTFGSSKDRALKAFTPLVRIACHVARNEMSFSAFGEEVELNVDNGCQLTSAYSNREGCKAMVHLMADEFFQRQRNHVINGAGGCHFHSWLVDGFFIFISFI